MKRKDAATLIDATRAILYDCSKPGHRRVAELQLLFDRAGLALVPCDGEAHSNPHIDNCARCAPRWGWIGKREPIT